MQKVIRILDHSHHDVCAYFDHGFCICTRSEQIKKVVLRSLLLIITNHHLQINQRRLPTSFRLLKRYHQPNLDLINLQQSTQNKRIKKLPTHSLRTPLLIHSLQRPLHKNQPPNVCRTIKVQVESLWLQHENLRSGWEWFWKNIRPGSGMFYQQGRNWAKNERSLIVDHWLGKQTTVLVEWAFQRRCKRGWRCQWQIHKMERADCP